jgi:P-type conjugative transfer protein TrbJ
MLKYKSLFTSTVIISLFTSTIVNGGGPVTGGASEWTQLLNNVELGKLVGLETQALQTSGNILSAEIQQVKTQIETYQTVLRNLEKVSDNYLAEAMEPVEKLRGLMAETNAIVKSGKSIDEFLRSGLISDPLFKKEPLDEAKLSERYDEWVSSWESSVDVGLQKIGLTLEDVATEGDLLDKISARFGGEEGHMQVLQASNELSASLGRQMNDLRALTATQAQQSTVAWGRVLGEMDAKEASDRELEVEINQSLDSIDKSKSGHRSIHEILRLGDYN